MASRMLMIDNPAKFTPEPQGWLGLPIVQQAVGQLPWEHNPVLLDKLPDPQMVCGHWNG